MAGVREGFAGILRMQWVSYWRRFSRTGSAGKNGLILLGLIALAMSARYASILKSVTAETRKGQFGELDLLAAGIFVLCVSPVWEMGASAMGPRALARFPLTGRERLTARICGGLSSPICWIAMLVCASLVWPLAVSPHPICGVIAGLAFLRASLMTGYGTRDVLATATGRWAGRAGAAILLAAAVLVWLRMGRGSAAALHALPPHLVALAAGGSWAACGVLVALAVAATWFARAGLTWMLESAPAATNRKAASSATMTLRRKDLRYFRRLEGAVWLILLGLAFYLATAAAPEPDAARVVLAFTSVLGSTAVMNAFGADGVAGLDRYRLWPLSASSIIATKNSALALLAGARSIPILVLALWRFGWREGMYDSLEAASLLLATLAWGNVCSVRHPYTGDEATSVLDQVIGLAASAVPGAVTIGVLRGGPELAPFAMCGMAAVCALLYAVAVRWAGSYYMREFESMRARISV